MVELFANSGDPDQMLHSATSDLGLHCLPVTILGVSSLLWVNVFKKSWMDANSAYPDNLPYFRISQIWVYTVEECLFT